MPHILDELRLHQILGHGHDGNRGSRTLSGKSCRVPKGRNHCGPTRNQFCRDHGQAANVPVSVSKIQLDIAAIDKADGRQIGADRVSEGLAAFT